MGIDVSRYSFGSDGAVKARSSWLLLSSNRAGISEKIVRFESMLWSTAIWLSILNKIGFLGDFYIKISDKYSAWHMSCDVSGARSAGNPHATCDVAGAGIPFTG